MKKYFKLKLHSFKYAFEGIKAGFDIESNLAIHFFHLCFNFFIRLSI